MPNCILTELNGRMVVIEVFEKDGIPQACVRNYYDKPTTDEPTLEFFYGFGTYGIKSTYSELKENYEIVEVDCGRGYLIKKSMTDEEIRDNFSNPLKIKYKRVEVNYYRIWNHDLISYADNSKETQEWMDKYIRPCRKEAEDMAKKLCP